MVENDKSIKCTKFCKIDQNVDYVSMWCGRRYVDTQESLDVFQQDAPFLIKTTFPFLLPFLKMHFQKKKK